ncbi:hypothetical protein B0H63DRAFT_187200 [Podospora didyma]|uniref:Uncharacterized protein n=1 Tax=Podospora didyma TaxID=330526 RepID=A0AAE0NQA8_9PEZI|nr:hypothetical protein B0H63DRAFT_187200 [Podospora didyma]
MQPAFEDIPLPSIQPRAGVPYNRSMARYSSSDDSDSSSVSEFDKSPPRSRGLRPPPLRTKSFMPPIPGSPTDEVDKGDGISPLMSRAPPPRSGTNLTVPPRVVMPDDVPASPSDDIIPEEHIRVPGLIPRSPLHPLGTFRSKRNRKPVPPPIIVHAPPESLKGVLSAGMVSVKINTPIAAKPKRRTVWGLIDGWWDLGLLERMNTIKRKK